MFKRRDDHYYIEEFERLGIEAIYTTAEFDFEKFQKGKKVAHGFQTHSNNIEIFDEQLNFEALPIPDRDGFITSRKDLVLYTKHADCLALYFYDRVKKVIGVCHSGWRGSFDEIGVRMVQTMESDYGSSRENILIGIGIGISPENYEVSKEFVENFKDKYEGSLLEGVFIEREEKFFFDNERFNLNLFLNYGVPRENIICSELCTYRDKSLHSYRRDREKSGRNRAYIYYGMG